MHVFVRDHYTMIAAPVQCDVDGVPKRSHNVLLKRANSISAERRNAANTASGAVYPGEAAPKSSPLGSNPKQGDTR
jgi:hypothetical protein